MTSPSVHVYLNETEAAEGAADFVTTLVAETLGQRRPFRIALAGGNTPRRMYEILASPTYANRLAWARWEVFWGDERAVAPDHPDSNYRMARLALLSHVNIPSDQVYRMRGELAPQEAAEEYERRLREVFKESVPVFDLVLLGMGTDGHTASLFPGTAAVENQEDLIVANWAPALDAHRLTLTLPVINAARNVLFLVTGEDKAQAVKAVLELGDEERDLLPAALVRPESGNLVWHLDRAAASLLTEPATA